MEETRQQAPLSDFLSGTQRYLELEGRSLRLKAYKATVEGTQAATTFFVSLGLSLLVAAFGGLALAFALALLMPAPLAFLVTSLVFVLLLFAARKFIRHTAALRDELTKRITGGELHAYDQLRQSALQAQQDATQCREELNERLQTIKGKTERLESMLGSAPSGILSRTARSLAGPALRMALESLILPKAGVVKRAIVPAIAGLVLNGGARKLVSSIFRKRRNASPGSDSDGK